MPNTTPTSADLFFKGRPGDPRLGEWIKRLKNLDEISVGKTKSALVIAIMGCPDDTGVTRNRGRAGAALGPDSIRKHLYKMTLPMDAEWEGKIEVVDAGNIVPGDDILKTHEAAHETVRLLTDRGAHVIALGGGHDFAAPNFSGFASGLGRAQTKRLGLINVDPHLDVRASENGRPHSGTPFRQLLDNGVLRGKDFVEFGARANRNAREHFAYCKRFKVPVLTLESLREDKAGVVARYRKVLSQLASACTTVGATFDMDSCSDAEGTSAAPVLGFTAWELCRMSEAAGSIPKVKYFEVAEVAPTLDPAERSSRIAAEMIYSFLSAKARKS